MKNIKFAMYQTSDNTGWMCSILPAVLLERVIDEHPKSTSITLHWLIFGFHIIFFEKKKLYVTCRNPNQDSLRKNKEYVVIYTNLLSYVIKDDNGKQIQVSKTRFYDPIEK